MSDYTYRVGDRLVFQTIGSPFPISNIWKINNQTIAEAINPTFEYIFISPGLYSISHEGTNECGPCIPITKTVLITTLPLPIICDWITNKGGISSITIPNIFELVDAYLGITNINFIPTIKEILGTIDYYLGFISSGNSNTGCVF